MTTRPNMITSVRKRDGRIVPFASTKIEAAIAKALAAVGEGPGTAAELTAQVAEALHRHLRGAVPSVEQVQDAIEEVSMTGGHPAVAKAYILCRQNALSSDRPNPSWGSRMS